MFVPEAFAIPEVLETDAFRLRMLSVADAVKDYDAVMTSIAHLRTTFAYSRQHSVFSEGWPSDDLSLMDNVADLGWHQVEFKRRSSFAYTVMTTDESQCLGCVYILPAERYSVDAEIYLWVRQSAYDKGFDPVLFQVVKRWIAEAWPFERVAYPGRNGDDVTSCRV